MRLVIADTSPVNYLILIGHIELLPRLFERVVVPSTVRAELGDPGGPPEVRDWIANPPAWLETYSTSELGNVVIEGLDEGEAAAIVLAEFLHADLLLIDERDGFRVARKRGFQVTGTLGVLDIAAERGLVNFAEAIRGLEQTNFRRPIALLETLLKKHEEQRS